MDAAYCKGFVARSSILAVSASPAGSGTAEPSSLISALLRALLLGCCSHMKACGHQEAHDKMMTDPITCDYPGYGGYASAREQLLEMGQQADNNQVQALACKLGDWDQLRTDVTGKLAGKLA